MSIYTTTSQHPCMSKPSFYFSLTILREKQILYFQSNYLRLLEKHVASNEPKDLFQSKFANILNSLTVMREMADIKKARLLNHSACSQYSSSDEANKWKSFLPNTGCSIITKSQNLPVKHIKTKQILVTIDFFCS